MLIGGKKIEETP